MMLGLSVIYGYKSTRMCYKFLSVVSVVFYWFHASKQKNKEWISDVITVYKILIFCYLF